MFSFIKKVPVRVMRACSQIAGRSLFFIKCDGVSLVATQNLESHEQKTRQWQEYNRICL